MDGGQHGHGPALPHGSAIRAWERGGAAAAATEVVFDAIELPHRIDHAPRPRIMLANVKEFAPHVRPAADR